MNLSSSETRAKNDELCGCSIEGRVKWVFFYAVSKGIVKIVLFVWEKKVARWRSEALKFIKYLESVSENEAIMIVWKFYNLYIKGNGIALGLDGDVNGEVEQKDAIYGSYSGENVEPKPYGTCG